MTTVKTTCPYCGVGCGVEAAVEEVLLPATSTTEAVKSKDIIAVEGAKTHPANYGRLCVKGSALHETLSQEGRLLFPKVRGQRSDWDTALSEVADTFKKTVEKHGPDSVAFYLSGQLLTEDYYVANKLMKGFIGTANVDTNSRLCMASAVVGYKRAFGSDTVPCNYEDLESCDLLILIGSNAAWTHPVLYQRMVAAKKARPNMRVVVIDPRRTATADIADLHLAISPGSDAALFNGLLTYLAAQNALDQDYIDQYTEGFDGAIAAAKAWTPATTAEATGLNMQELETFFQWYADTEKTVSFYSMGINQSSSGTDKCNAIINAHLATGRIGREGMGPFSITGQPNAMGGREVGGLANQLAAHMGFEDESIDRVARFWNAENMATQPGLLAVDLFEAIESGKVKAVWVMATNPVVSLPNADQIKRALDKCEFVVVSDCIEKTDTGTYADVLLPAMGWSEKSGTVTNSERRISIQPPLKAPSGEAQDDWWIISEVAKRMGWGDAFDYQSAHDIFTEHAQLSAFENNGSRDFDIGGLAGLTEEQFWSLEPIQWPVPTAESTGTSRMFSDGRFFTPSGKAQFIAIKPRSPVAAPSKKYPLLLNTGRIRDHWHTMTRTGKAQRLSNHIDAPYISIHPSDARLHEIQENQLIELFNQYGRYHAGAKIDTSVPQGSVFAPMHWTGENASTGRVGAIVNPHCDPLSGQPESKSTPVALKKVQHRFSGAIASSYDFNDTAAEYWVKSRIDKSTSGLARGHTNGYRYELKYDTPIDWRSKFQSVFGEEAQLLELFDRENQTLRIAAFTEGKIVAVAYQTEKADELPEALWLNDIVGSSASNPVGVLAGKTPNSEDKGKLICSCFQIGEKQICAAIKNGADSAEKLGETLKCGTNCGSCIPELRALIATTQTEDQASETLETEERKLVIVSSH